MSNKPLRGSVKYRKAYERYFRAFGRMNAAFDEMRENFLRSDPVSQRLIAMKDMIEETIPINPLSDSYEIQQAMRSRGLAIAAMCGLTHYGYPGPAKEAK